MGWFGHLTLFLYLVYTPYEMCKVEGPSALDICDGCFILNIEFPDVRNSPALSSMNLRRTERELDY